MIRHTRIGIAALVVGASLLVIGAPNSAQAQQYESARLIGMAEAHRALAFSNDAIYINPAGLALGTIYSLELGYLDDIRGSDRRFNASVVDSQAGPIAGGLAYTWTKRRPDALPAGDERVEGHRAEVALATRVTDSAAIGVTARYMTFDQNDANGDAIEGEGYSIFTIDVGFQWRVTEGLSIGLAGYNLTNSDERDIPIGWGAGIGYQLGKFSLEGDVRYNAQRGEPLYSGAAAYVIGDFLAARAGVSYDLESKGVAISVGAGVILDKFTFDIGYRQLVNADDVGEDSDQRILGLSIGLQFF